MEVTIIIDGGSYDGIWYAPADLVKYIGDDFVNHGNTTIYLYKTIGQGTNYPRIVMPSNQVPYYQSSQGYGNTYITTIPNFSYNSWGNYYREKDYYEIILLTVLAFCAIWRMIHK